MALQNERLLAQRVFLPRVPESKPEIRPSSIKNWVDTVLMPFLREFIRAVGNDAERVHQSVNDLTDRGPNIAGAATIEITHRTHGITGSPTITRIEAEPGFRGILYLLALEPFTLTVVAPPAGNIAHALIASTGQLVTLVYDVYTDLWYPINSTNGGGGGGTVVDYDARGETALNGTKDSANTTFTLPGSLKFHLDASGNVVGMLMWKANILKEVSGAPAPFQYRRTSLTTIELGIAPDPGDYLAFLTLLIAL